MNTTGQWINMATARADGAKLSLSTLHSSYAKWANDELGWAVSKKKLADQLREHDYESKVSHGVTMFLNIRLAEPEPEDIKPEAKQDDLQF